MKRDFQDLSSAFGDQSNKLTLGEALFLVGVALAVIVIILGSIDIVLAVVRFVRWMT